MLSFVEDVWYRVPTPRVEGMLEEDKALSRMAEKLCCHTLLCMLLFLESRGFG